jgi:hypothetical protein
VRDIDAARAKLRREAIRRALYLVWPRPMGPGLLTDALPADLSTGARDLERAVYYLRDRGEIAEDAGADTPLWRLTAAGIEAHEAEPDYGDDARRAVRMLRLRVLQALDLGRPQPMGTRLIGLALADDTDLDLSEPSLRRALRYLSERELAAAAGGEAWRITSGGIDYLASEGDAVAGVARPLSW